MTHPAPSPTFRVCLDARVDGTGAWGGVQQTIIGLASGLSRLSGPEEFSFLVNEGSFEWLRPHLGGAATSLVVPRGSDAGPAWRRIVERAVPRRALDRFVRSVGEWIPPPVPDSDGATERSGMEVMHFTLQSGFRTRIPSIYVPHDLQHLHLPELFTRAQRLWRASFYPTLCRQAAYVVALSRWGKADLVRTFGLPEDKVRVIGWAPVIDTYPAPTELDLEAVRARYALPEAFVLYPAQTFRHKNHLGLLDALSLLRERGGLRVPVICSGYKNEFFPAIERRIAELGLERQVRFVGFVSPLELRCLYRLCRLVVFPSRFEGFGMPALEAFRLGVPVACSNATSLPEIVGDAALLFDPGNPHAIAEAIRQLWTDPDLRTALAGKGRERARPFTWVDTARRYRALYRLAGGRDLSDEDRELLARML